MTSNNLREKCTELYGETNGKKLFFAMEIIRKKDFCVATAWSEKEVSVAKACSFAGAIFSITDDYMGLKAPDGEVYLLRELKRENIVKYLPNAPQKDFNKHCSYDSKLKSN